MRVYNPSCFLKYKTLNKSGAPASCWLFPSLAGELLLNALIQGITVQHWTTLNWQSPTSAPKLSSLVWKAARGQIKVFIVGNRKHARHTGTDIRGVHISSTSSVSLHPCTASYQPADGTFGAVWDTQHTCVHTHTWKDKISPSAYVPM